LAPAVISFAIFLLIYSHFLSHENIGSTHLFVGSCDFRFAFAERAVGGLLLAGQLSDAHGGDFYHGRHGHFFVQQRLTAQIRKTSTIKIQKSGGAPTPPFFFGQINKNK
jgi:hypothetical protein